MRKTRTRYRAFTISIKSEAESDIFFFFSHGFIGPLPINAGNRKLISLSLSSGLHCEDRTSHQ